MLANRLMLGIGRQMTIHCTPCLTLLEMSVSTYQWYSTGIYISVTFSSLSAIFWPEWNACITHEPSQFAAGRHSTSVPSASAFTYLQIFRPAWWRTSVQWGKRAWFFFGGGGGGGRVEKKNMSKNYVTISLTYSRFFEIPVTFQDYHNRALFDNNWKFDRHIWSNYSLILFGKYSVMHNHIVVVPPWLFIMYYYEHAQDTLGGNGNNAWKENIRLRLSPFFQQLESRRQKASKNNGMH